eukprot:241745-Pyramimonas_sp.AAC.2
MGSYPGVVAATLARTLGHDVLEAIRIVCIACVDNMMRCHSICHWKKKEVQLGCQQNTSSDQIRESAAAFAFLQFLLAMTRAKSREKISNPSPSNQGRDLPT